MPAPKPSSAGAGADVAPPSASTVAWLDMHGGNTLSWADVSGDQSSQHHQRMMGARNEFAAATSDHTTQVPRHVSLLSGGVSVDVWDGAVTMAAMPQQR